MERTRYTVLSLSASQYRNKHISCLINYRWPLFVLSDIDIVLNHIHLLDVFHSYVVLPASRQSGAAAHKFQVLFFSLLFFFKGRLLLWACQLFGHLKRCFRQIWVVRHHRKPIQTLAEGSCVRSQSDRSCLLACRSDVRHSLLIAFSARLLTLLQPLPKASTTPTPAEATQDARGARESRAQ